MAAQIIDGKAVAQATRGQVALRVQQRLAAGKRAPGLAVVLVGADPASQVYVGSKRKACEEVGFESFSYDLPSSTTQQELFDLIDQLNADKTSFESDVRNNENWMTATLKPACAPVINKPVAVVTSFYACGYDQQSALAELPHCKTLPNLDALKVCIKKAGSKAKAQEICNVQN